MKLRVFNPLVVVSLAAAVVMQPGCQREPELQATPLLAEARSGESNFSANAPTNPYKQAGANLLTRTVFEAPGPEGTRLEVRDLWVAPGTKTEKLSLPGPAVLEVLSGEGTLIAGERSEALTQGSSTSLAQNATGTLDSRGITPLVLRARIFVP